MFTKLILQPELFQQLLALHHDNVTNAYANSDLGKFFIDYPDFKYVEKELQRRQVKFPEYSLQQLWDIMGSGSSEDLRISNRLYDDLESMPIDPSNLYNHNGEIINVSKLNPHEVVKLAKEVDDLDKFESLEHIRSIYINTAPNVKLYYPEPFIASPSFIHNDLGFLHILQYQYWLWFFFIFLIVFYLLSFLCVVRWCANRTQPRRETRGVSRSKCGDLITATVPITWAITIIVSESTDATDYYDGFGTGELIVGVRAYQWGWEYYYPKNIDLNYNLKPNYSTFIGNSLKYNGTTDKTINTKDVWRFYQNKIDDAVVTPAHLLVIPLDNLKIFNFMNFDNIGASTLKESNAFKKIRTHSKVYTTNLVHTPSIFTDKYIKMSSLFNNENDLNTSINYGLKRQHNLTSVVATNNINSTFLDKHGLDKFLTYNLQFNTDLKKTNLHSTKLDLFKKELVNNSDIKSSNTLNTLLSDNLNRNNVFKLLSLYPNIVKEMGDNSDKKKIKHPLTKILNNSLLNCNLLSKDLLVNSLDTNTTFSNAVNFIDLTLNNESHTSKDFMLNSFNQGVSSDKQSARFYSKMETNANLSLGINSLDSNINLLNKVSPLINQSSYYFLNKNSWTDLAVFSKLSSNRLYLDSPFAPIINNNPLTTRMSYDKTGSIKYSNEFNNNVITTKVNIKKDKLSPILSGRSDSSLASLRSNYWQMFWANTNPDFRINQSIKMVNNQEFFYLPLFTNYYDYDFRNAQALDMLEELFWESSYSSYNHLDYLNINDNATKVNSSNTEDFTIDSNYFNEDLSLNLTSSIFANPTLNDYSVVGNFYSNNIQLDDFIIRPNLLSTKDFVMFPVIDSSTTIDDTYINFKQLASILDKSSSVLLNFNSTFNYPQSYLSVLNNFRSDYSDFHFYTDLLTNSDSKSLTNDNFSLVSDFFNTNDHLSTNSTRYSNPITLRSTAKNSIVTYSALQKVFKARFEEGRSNSRITNFADIRVQQPFMTGGRVSFEKLLGKNKESFYNTTFYVSKPFTVFNDLASINNSLNTYFFDFPFLLSLMSDPSRFLWFDWYTKWSLVEVQPAPASKFSIVGVPFYKKHFDFNLDSNDTLSETENYFSRLAYARKNYLPTWAYTPYIYTRSKVWLSNNPLASFIDNGNNIALKKTLISMNWYWTTLGFTKNTSETFTPTFSNSNRNCWRPYTSIQAYYYNNAVLTDILTHREFLYRQYLEVNNKVINLPKVLTANPQNPLISEIRSTFLLIDPITYNAEYSREFYYTTLTYFKFLLFKDWTSNLNRTISNLPINTSFVTNYLFFYFLDNNYSNKLGNNQDLFKSQYRPLKKGISNMLRLHGTGAVALPIEIRLQILASSRDVIHSWAIPSAGVKIDCIPGYTSHRIMIFLTPGIYWGQCQEICGRYHHWMPIIVYFMKRDLFFLWCTHFMSKSNYNSTLTTNDRQFTDYIKFASYDRSTWLTEISKNM